MFVRDYLASFPGHARAGNEARYYLLVCYSRHQYLVKEGQLSVVGVFACLGQNVFGAALGFLALAAGRVASALGALAAVGRLRALARAGTHWAGRRKRRGDKELM